MRIQGKCFLLESSIRLPSEASQQNKAYKKITEPSSPNHTIPPCMQAICREGQVCWLHSLITILLVQSEWTEGVSKHPVLPCGWGNGFPTFLIARMLWLLSPHICNMQTSCQPCACFPLLCINWTQRGHMLRACGICWQAMETHKKWFQMYWCSPW